MSNYHDEDNDFEQYVEYREVSWFTRIKQAITGVFFGFLLFIIALIIINFNEGNTILNQAVQQAIPISSDVVNNQKIGKLVITSGVITTNEKLGDDVFIQAGDYISISRNVEMYSWVEEEKKESQTNVGGSQTQKITTNYRRRWVPTKYLNRKSSPFGNTESTSFRHPQNRHNPTPKIKTARYTVKDAKIGAFNLVPSRLTIPTPTQLQLSPQNLISTDKVRIFDNYLYQGSGNLQNPNIGDLRIQYKIFGANTNGTVVGKLLASDRIGSYVHTNNRTFYRLFYGNESTAIAQIKKEDHIYTWGFRFLSFILIWCGLNLIAEPINVILDFIPIFGSIGRLFTSFTSALIALLITIVATVVFYLRHSLI